MNIDITKFKYLGTTLVTAAIVTSSCTYVGKADPDKLNKKQGSSEVLTFKGIDGITVDNGYINLSWPKGVSDESSTVRYTVYSGAFQTKIQNTSDLTLSLGLEDYKKGDTPTYSVRAIDGAKNEDANAVTKTITLSGTPFCTPFKAIEASAASDTRVNLSFSTCEDATEYQIFSKGAAGQAVTLVQTVPASTQNPMTALVTGLTPGKTYSFYVRAYDTKTNTDNPIGSKDSNALSVTTLSEGLPQFDGIVTAAARSGSAGMTQVDITWKKGRSSSSTRSVRYHVYYGTSSATTFSTAKATTTSVYNANEGYAITSSQATTTSITGLTPSTEYYFGVRTYELDGDGNVIEEQNSVLLKATTNSPDETLGPSLTAVSPAFDAPAGGASVAITGANLNPGAKILFGTTEATSITWNSATSITAVAPGHSAGVVDLTYRSASGRTAVLSQSFSFTSAAAPTITSVNKSAVNKDGGDVVTITGTGFVTGAKVVLAGSTITPSSISSTSIVFTTVGSSAGIYDLVVRNADLKTGTLASALTFMADPTISTISPGVGSSAGGALLTVNGTNFADPMTVSIGGTACINVSVISSTQLTCTTPARAAATVAVSVSNQATRTATLAAALIITSNAAPVISSISPSAGPTGGANTLTITGTGFVAGASVKVGSANCTSVSVVSATSITCVMPSSSAGVKQIMVVLSDTQESNTNNYTYTASSGPFITTISPTVGYWPVGSTGTAPTVTISGTTFSTSGGTVKIGGTTCTITTATSTSIVCSLGTKVAGTYDLVVTNSDGQIYTSTNGFTYAASVPPTVTTVTPSNGATAGGTGITIAGTGFVTGATVKINGVTCTSPSVISATSMTCTTPSSSSSGLVNVVVSNPDTQTGTKTNGFLYLGPVTITSVLPSQGALAGSTPITITGTGFATPAVVTINNASCTSVVVVSSTQVTCNTPGNSAGTYGVKLTNPDSQYYTMNSAYTYQAAPLISSLTPSSGSPSGGTNVVITGTNFFSGITLTIGGQSCASLTRDSSTQLTCVTPARTGPSVSTVDLVVTNTDSQTTTMTAGYTYNQFSRVDLVAGVFDMAGYQDGTGSAVRFKAMGQFASDGTYLYAADNPNRVIRKIHMTTGATTTIAGNSAVNACNAGTGSSANFMSPRGIAIDSTNTYLFISDPTCNVTYRITIATGVSEIWASATFPAHMVMDATDTYLYGPVSHNVSRLNLSTGVMSNFSGTGVAGFANGAAGVAQFNGAGGLARVGSTLYVADQSNHLIRAVSMTDGSVTTFAGTQGVNGNVNGTGTAATFYNPANITTDGTNLYVGAYSNNNIRKIVISTAAVTHLISPNYGSTDPTYHYADGQFPGTAGWAVYCGSYYNGGALYADTNYLYTSCYDANVRKYQFSNSNITTIAGFSSPTAGVYPWLVSADGAGANARFYWTSAVTEGVFWNIGLFTDGTSLYGTEFWNGLFRFDTTTSTKTNRFTVANHPEGAVVVGGYAYINSRNGVIYKYNMTTTASTTWAGQFNANTNVDGVGTAATFYYPSGMVTDGTYIYVTTLSHTIRKIEISTATVTTIAGSPGSTGTADGTGSAARFNWPAGLTLVGTDLYIADRSNHCIRKLDTTTNAVTTLVGLCGAHGYVNSQTMGSVRFYNPLSITSDGVGNLYVADLSNKAIRQIKISTGATTTLAGRGTYPYDYELDGTLSQANFGELGSIVWFNNKLYVAGPTNIRVIQ